MTGETVEVARLTLKLQGISAPDGELVARLVAESLAEEPEWRHGSDIKAQVVSQGTPPEIARSIAAELRRLLGAER